MHIVSNKKYSDLTIIPPLPHQQSILQTNSATEPDPSATLNFHSLLQFQNKENPH